MIGKKKESNLGAYAFSIQKKNPHVEGTGCASGGFG